MASKEVYLDHLIPRENLRYKRAKNTDDLEAQNEPPLLRISDLVGDHLSSRRRILRKPDFQRPTWAWVPADCVSLLDSVVKGQVIPSIIMWSSDDSGFDFILDGAHRISVVMAWLLNDWGDRLPSDSYGDDQKEADIKSIAREVREIVNIKIGSFESYKAANDEFDKIVDEGNDIPRKVMEPIIFEKAQFYRRLQKGVGFHILWVGGDYESAEKSFLKINKSGKQLDEWETKLIENRNSSFARAVMSIPNVDVVEHYWPQPQVDEIPDEAKILQGKVTEIVSGIRGINSKLFAPPKPTMFTKLGWPLMDVPERYKRPYWAGELLTIFQGYQGFETDTQKLLEKGRDSTPSDIIDSGHILIKNASNALEHLIGSSQRSLNIVASLYFYTSSGRYVRSLLYGFIYWILAGTPEEVLMRKRIFSAYRDSFEKVIFDRKEDAATGITRSIGSGPEVTKQTALYYDQLLGLLAEFKGDIYSDNFKNGYSELVKRATNKKPSLSDLFVSTNRTFPARMKAEKFLDTVIKSAPTCGICKGIIDLELDVQHDHMEEWAKGGKTATDNHRLAHPFCNNHQNRQEIEKIKANQENIRLPYFSVGEDSILKQLNFFSEFKYS